MKCAVAVLALQLGCWSKPELPADAGNGIPGPMPMLIGVMNMHAGTATTLSFPLTIPQSENRFLIVAAAMSGETTSTPSVTSVTYGNVQMTPLVAISGVPSGPTSRSEQWQLVAPPIGTADVIITLVTQARTIHGGALAFSGVNQTDPVRDTGMMSGDATSSSVVITSAIDDLVESTVANGSGIMDPAFGQTKVYVDNVDTMFALNNSGASTAAGVAGQNVVTWTFDGSDVWQGLAASLRPVIVQP